MPPTIFAFPESASCPPGAHVHHTVHRKDGPFYWGKAPGTPSGTIGDNKTRGPPLQLTDREPGPPDVAIRSHRNWGAIGRWSMSRRLTDREPCQHRRADRRPVGAMGRRVSGDGVARFCVPRQGHDSPRAAYDAKFHGLKPDSAVRKHANARGRWFDLAGNGGRVVKVNIAAAGYFSVQRGRTSRSSIAAAIKALLTRAGPRSSSPRTPSSRKNNPGLPGERAGRAGESGAGRWREGEWGTRTSRSTPPQLLDLCIDGIHARVDPLHPSAQTPDDEPQNRRRNPEAH